MRLLFVFPFCSPGVNSISGGPIYIGNHGHDALVITARNANSLKGDVTAPEHEYAGATEFFRPYPHSNDIIRRPHAHWGEVRRKIDEFRPDVVVGFGEFNYRLPLRISTKYNLPLFFYMEYLRPEKVASPIPGRSFLRRYAPALHDAASRMFLRYLARRSRAIMFAYYGDRDRIAELGRNGTRAYYVPWCTDVGVDDGSTRRDLNVGIYIGSLEPFKNSGELVSAIPIILDETPTERFIVVGPGSYAPRVKQLRGRYGSRLEYIESVPRKEAMQLLRSAGYGYTPVHDCGLGFIGDCWGTGTPLITTHELDGFLNAGVDTLVAKGYRDLPRMVALLQSQAEVRNGLVQAGLKRYQDSYTAEAVGTRYVEIISGMLPAEQSRPARPVAGPSGNTK